MGQDLLPGHGGLEIWDLGSGIIPTPFPSEIFPLFIFPGCSPASQRSQGLHSLHSMGLGTGSSSCSCSRLNSHCDPWDQTRGEIRDGASFPGFPLGCGYLGNPWIPDVRIIQSWDVLILFQSGAVPVLQENPGAGGFCQGIPFPH